MTALENVYAAAKVLEGEHTASGQHAYVALDDYRRRPVALVCPCGEYKVLVIVTEPAQARVL